MASVWVCDTVLVMSGAAMEAGRVVEFWDEFAPLSLVGRSGPKVDFCEQVASKTPGVDGA